MNSPHWWLRFLQFAQNLLVRRASLLVYLSLLTLLSLLPESGLPRVKLFPHADKLIHMTMYAGFTFLLFYNWPLTFSRWRAWLPLLAVVVWGMIMEVLQGAGGMGRAFDLLDEAANISGFFPGWLIWRWFDKQLQNL